MHSNREPIARVGSPKLLRGDGRQLSVHVVQLSQTPSNAWRTIFNDAAATNKAVSGYTAEVFPDGSIQFEASPSIMRSRLVLIDGWIERANEATAEGDRHT